MAAATDGRHPRKCTAHSRRTGQLCEGWAAVGSTVCRFHGAGKNTHAKRVGLQRVERARAERAVAAYGLPVEIDPHTALLEELWRTAGHVAWLRDRVADLPEHGMYGPVGGGETSVPRQEPHVWIALYQQERSHLAKVARDCISAGIEERRVRLAERQAQLMATAIRGILTELGVADRPETPAVVRRHLTMVAGGTGA